jgi:FkbM family methyltransferase
LRLRDSGRIIAFEPDNHNFSLLQQHVSLNGLEQQIELHQCAVSDKDGQGCFSAECSPMSHLISPGANYSTIIQVTTLDSVFAGERIDILKIDVEGYEEMVLRGAHDLLRSPARRPRAVFVEVHPYAWPSLGTTSASLLSLLSASGYRAETPSGEPVRNIEQHGEIVARIMS